MTGGDEPASTDGWERFARAPSIYAHPSYLAPLFDGAIGEDVAATLGRRPRFARRLSDILVHRLALEDAAPPASAADRTLAQLPADRLKALAQQAGAVSRADAVAREVRADRVTALKEAIGENAYAAALAHRADAVVAEEPESVEALADAIAQDGLACLAVWIDGLSAGVARRVRLRFPADFASVEPRAGLREAGPRILRMLAS